MQAYRLSLGEIKNCFLEVSKGLLSADLIVEGVRVLWESSDEVEVELGRLYKRQRLWAESRDEQLWSHLFTGLLSGRLSGAEFEKTILHFELSEDLIYVPLRIRGASDSKTKELQQQIEFQHQGLAQRPVFSMVDGDLACLLRNIPDDSVSFDDLVAGLGEGATLENIAVQWKNASVALDTALAFGLSGCHSSISLGLRPLVVSENQVGSSLVKKYCGPFLEQGEFGAQILESVFSWLNNSRNFARAAEELFIHPNTLRYRLRKFAEVTSSDFDNLTTLVEIWWSLERWRTVETLRIEPLN